MSGFFSLNGSDKGTYAPFALAVSEALRTPALSAKQRLNPSDAAWPLMTVPPTVSSRSSSQISGTTRTVRLLPAIAPSCVSPSGVRMTGAHAWTLDQDRSQNVGTLAADAPAGSTTLTATSAGGFTAGTYRVTKPRAVTRALNTGEAWTDYENITVSSVTGSGPYTLNLAAPLSRKFYSGDVVITLATPAPGFNPGAHVVGGPAWANVYATPRFTILTDAPIIEWRFAASNGANYRLTVDGQKVTTSLVGSLVGGGGQPANGAVGLISAVFSVGSATIVASTGVFTVTPPAGVTGHGLSVGDRVVLGAITTTTGITAGASYYVKTVPSATTFTLATKADLATSPTLTGDGSTAWVAPAKLRRVELEINVGVAAIDLGVADTLFPMPEPNVKALFFGDSYMGYQDGIEATVCRLLGWESQDTDGVGGTGYESHSAYNDQLANRIETAMVAQPDVIVVLLGLNDNDASSTLQAEATADLTRIMALKKATAKVFAFGPWPVRDQTNAGKQNVARAIKAACAASGATYVDTILGEGPMPNPWVYGSGNSGTPTGDGNADVMINPDATHPSALGRQHLAFRIAQSLLSYF